MDPKIRPYCDADFHRLLRVWKESMSMDALTPAAFIRRVLLDENRAPESLLVAEAGGEVVGFVLGLVLRHPIEKVGLMEKRGFITAFGVAPGWRRRGVGAALFEAAERKLQDLGRTEVAVAPYPPNYFIPGVDKENYAEAVGFLRQRGYAEFLEALAMDAPIGQFRLSAEVVAAEQKLREEGVEVQPLTVDRLVSYLNFMETIMPGDWVETARDRLTATADSAGVFDSIFVATDRDAIIGYCQFDQEHFGPFGVAGTHQGRGIGSVLLARTLLQMRMRGHHAAYVLWTGERAAKGVYGKLGFAVTRRFALMRKSLST
jgi:mycothiol synthase